MKCHALANISQKYEDMSNLSDKNMKFRVRKPLKFDCFQKGVLVRGALTLSSKTSPDGVSAFNKCLGDLTFTCSEC